MLNLKNFSIVKLAYAASDASAGGGSVSGWSGTCVSNGAATIRGFECLFKNILQILVYVAGIAFFITFIIGGFKFLTAGGDPKKAASASSTLTLSIVGLVGTIISWLAILFIEKLTGVKVTIFKIGT